MAAYSSYSLPVQLLLQYRDGYQPTQQQLLLLELESPEERRELYLQLTMEEWQKSEAPTAQELLELLQEMAQDSMAFPDYIEVRVRAGRGELAALVPLLGLPRADSWAIEASVRFERLPVLEYVLTRVPDPRSLNLEQAIRGAINEGKLELLQWLEQFVPAGKEVPDLYQVESVPPGRADILAYILKFYTDQKELNWTIRQMIENFPETGFDYDGEIEWDFDKLRVAMPLFRDPTPYEQNELQNYASNAYYGDHLEAADLLLSPLEPAQRSAWADRMAEQEPRNLKYLLERGANPNLILVEAARRERLDLMEAALARGATDLNYALEEAVSKPTVVGWLLARGARTDKYEFNPDFTIAHDYEQEEYDQHSYSSGSDEDLEAPYDPW